MEGGWQQRVEEEKEKESDEELDDEKAQNKMVQSILSKDTVSVSCRLTLAGQSSFIAKGATG